MTTDRRPASSRTTRGERRVGLVVAVVGALVIAALTLTPSLNEHTLTGFCIVCGDQGAQDFLDNVLLFVPLTLGLCVSGVRTRRAMTAAFVASATIELLQRWVIPGRDASVGDVLSNSLGGVAGALLGAHWRALLFPDARRARVLAGVGAAAWLAMVAATAWLVGRSVPRSAAGFDVQWRPELFAGERYAGRVLDASLDTLPLSPGHVSEAAMRETMRGDSVTFRATITAVAARPRGGEVIVRVASARGDSAALLVLGRRGCDVALEIRTRVHDARLRPPSVAARNVFPCAGRRPSVIGAKEGDTLRVAGAATSGRLHLAVQNARTATMTSGWAGLSPAIGWSFFLPWYPPLDESSRPLSALWLGGLLLPVGYWAVRGRRRDSASRDERSGRVRRPPTRTSRAS